MNRYGVYRQFIFCLKTILKMRLKEIFSLSFLTIILINISFSQSNSEQYKFIEVEDVPVKRAVTDFAQDTNGFLWFATYGAGLFKYDGNRFITYKNIREDKNSLSSSLVHALYADESGGGIWIATEKGLSKYIPENDSFEQINLFGVNDNATIPIHCITKLNESSLIFGSHGNGVYKLDIKTKKVTQVIFDLPINGDLFKFNGIAKLNSKVYLGTSQGLFEFDPGNNKIVRSRFQINNQTIEIGDHINKLFSDGEDNLWMGTYSSGLVRLNFKNGKVLLGKYPITSKRILSIAKLQEGKVFVGTENDGLFILDRNGNLIDNYTNQKFGNNPIQSNSVWSLFVDIDQRIWIGYYSSGIGFYDRNYDKFKDIESIPFKENSLQHSSVTGIVEDDSGNLWISMDGGGIDVYNPENQKFTHLLDTANPIAKGLTSGDIQNIFLDSKKNLWASSWNSGIYCLPNGEKKFINYTQKDGLASRSAICFAEDAQGIIYVGTFNAGLHMYDHKTKRFTRLNSSEFSQAGIANCDVRKILIDNKGLIWVGTTKGLFTISKSKNSYQVVSQNEKMYRDRESSDLKYYILSLYQDFKGNIWIGTDGGGLCKYDIETGDYQWHNQIVKKQTIASITGDINNNLWIAGNNGISKYHIPSKAVVNYTKNDGLLANDFHNNAVLKSRDGHLYFGNYNGINYFDPHVLRINSKQPSLYFSGLRLFNREVKPNEKDSPLDKILSSTNDLTLKHNQSVFTIEYASIDFTRAIDNEFAYFLEGFDNDWNYVGNVKSATYTNLPAGNYTFKVKAANNDGIWTKDPISLGITILNPWWKQSWAVTLYILLLLLFTYMSYQFVQKRIEEKRLIEYERDKRQQEEELNNRKLQFFTNISHEFRTPLTLIKNPLEDIRNNKDFKFPKSIVDKHNTIYKNTERLIRLINELMDFRKLQFNKMSIKVEKIEITSFCENIAAHFKEEAYQRNIILDIISENPDLFIFADAGMLEKIIFNLLSNAFKATPENGLVSIVLRCPETPVLLPEISLEKPVEVLEITVEDTGFGIPEAEINKIFDPFYQVEGMNKQYYGGTGIGLEVVRSFLLLNKGKIEVMSEVEKGTKFKIFLALGTDHFKESEFLSIKDSSADEKEKMGVLPFQEEIEEMEILNFSEKSEKMETLLIVEDNFALRNYLKDQLKYQYKIIEATNGIEGLDLAFKVIPDIIITDVLMPKMDGVEFCRHIKNDIKTSHIPVLMLTAKAQSDDWLTGIEAGADTYINKPFDIKIVKSQIKQLITSRQILFNKYFKEVSNLDIKFQASMIDKNFISKVVQYVHAHIDDPDLNVERLAEELKLSRSQLYRKIKALTGQSANEFIRKIRLDKAKELIENGNETISEIGYKVGFATPSYFTRCFKAEFGKLPTEIK